MHGAVIVDRVLGPVGTRLALAGDDACVINRVRAAVLVKRPKGTEVVNSRRIQEKRVLGRAKGTEK